MIKNISYNVFTPAGRPRVGLVNYFYYNNGGGCVSARDNYNNYLSLFDPWPCQNI